MMNFSINGFGRTQVNSQETIPVRENSAIIPRKSVVLRLPLLFQGDSDNVKISNALLAVLTSYAILFIEKVLAAVARW